MKNNRNNIIAIMYDFDKTLCTKDMQEYTFIPNLGMEAQAFWKEANDLRDNTKMDQILTSMYLMYYKMKQQNQPLIRSYLNESGKHIELYKGVESWFKRINDYGHSLGFEIEHYIISSGLKEIIEGTSIGNEFKEIYASEFYYDTNGEAVWPKLSVNYTNKTQFLTRIKKGVLNISDDINLNKKMIENERRISASNMIYIGDGLTDIPCMKLTKEGGGISIAVYTDNTFEQAHNLLKDDRINYIAEANYEENSELDKIIKKIIKKMTIETELKNITYNQNINNVKKYR